MRKNITLTLLALVFVLFGEVNAQTVLLSEDFSGSALPSGWTRSQAAGSDGWEFGSTTALSSQFFPILAHTGGPIAAVNDDACNCDASEDYLITPSLTFGAGTAPIVQFDAYFGQQTYQGGTEAFTIEVSTDNGNTWTSVYAVPGDLTQWATYSVNLSAYAGQSVVIGFHYDDAGVWSYGTGLDNVSVYEAAALDAGVANAAIPPTIAKNAPLAVTGEITNYGANAITSVELSWSDGTTTYTDNITGLNIPTLGSYTFSHNDSIDIATTGNYVIQVWTGSVNGSADLNTGNDTLTFNLEVVDTLVQRNPLHEVFTSSSCPPCAPGNANLNTIFNPDPSKQVVLKYQMSWPGNGDPYFTDEGGDRRSYYGVNSVPTMFVDGGWGGNTNSYTSQLRDGFYDVPAFMDIVSEIRVECKKVSVDVTVVPYKDFPGNNILHLAVIEKFTYNNVATNGETEFDHVMKKMLPNANGTVIGALTAGQPQTFTLDYTFQGNYILPPNANSPVNHNSRHTIEEFYDLDVVAFVQNNSSQEIYQSTFSADMIDFDVALSELDPITNPTIGTPVQIGGTVTNWKDQIVSDLRVNYSVDGGPVISRTINNLAWTSKGDDAAFTFLSSWTPANGGNVELKVWIDNFNGGNTADLSPCNDTITQVFQITSNAPPTASFTFNQTSGLTVDFTNTSVDDLAWEWNFGDGNGSADENPSHTYANTGTYNVCLIATNGVGSDTTCQNVNVVTGIESVENFKELISIAPNPNDGNFRINSKLGLNGELMVLDLLGRVVYSESLNDFKSGVIALPSLEKGVYILNIDSNGNKYQERMIIE